MPSRPTVIATLPKNARERVRVALDNYQGHDLIDIRVVSQLTEGSDLWSPTKKGLSLAIGRLPALIEALQEAAVQAGDLGLIAGRPK